MKKTIIIIFLALALGFAGCQNNTKKPVNNQTIPTSNRSNATEQTTSNNQEKSNTNTGSNINTKSNNFNQESKKHEYEAKLDKIDLGFKGYNDASATTNAMFQEDCKEYNQWNDALNEIYGVLKVQLSASDMK